MFDKIVESVLSEISAEDAYNKYYNTIPKKMFDNLVELYGGKFDNLLKAVMKSVMEGYDYFQAERFLEMYKKAQNNVRMEFLKRFKEGEYEDVLDMLQGIKEIESNGVSTYKTRQKEGYVELYNDEKYLLTCTLTYEANHHFYGNSKWCTASDRMGRYDGWIYFLGYVFDENNIQSDYVYNRLGTEDYPIRCVLVQFTDKTKGGTYQMQVKKTREVGQICDFADNSLEEGEFFYKIFPRQLEKLLFSKLNELIAMEEKCFEIEYKYQRSRDVYVEQKRQILAMKRNKLAMEFRTKIQNEIEKKQTFVQSKFNAMKDNNLLSNPSFIKQLLKTSYDMRKQFYYNPKLEKEIASKYEEIAKAQSYIILNKIIKLYDNVFGLYFIGYFGHVHDIDYNNNDMPYIVDRFSTSTYYDGGTIQGGVMVIVTANFNQKINYEYEYDEAVFDENNESGKVNEYELFKDFDVINVIKIIKSEHTIGIYKMSQLAEQSFGKQIEEDETYQSLVLFQARGDNDTTCTLVNVKKMGLVEFKVEDRISKAHYYKDRVFFGEYSSGDYDYLEHEVNLQNYTLGPTYVSNYIGRSDGCDILTNLETGEICMLLDTFVQTGIKAESIGQIGAKIFGNRFIAFVDNPRNYLNEDPCYIYDIAEKKVIFSNVYLHKDRSRFSIYVTPQGSDQPFYLTTNHFI